MNSLFPIINWINSTWLSRTINDSKWLFPAIEGIHIVALALLFGAVIILNLRMYGLIMRTRSLPELSRELDPWTFCSLIVILATGALLFISEAIRSFRSGPFQIKLVLLAAAICFHYAVSRRLTRKEETEAPSMFRKAVAAVGIALWISVGFAGRAIGFF